MHMDTVWRLVATRLDYERVARGKSNNVIETILVVVSEIVSEEYPRSE